MKIDIISFLGVGKGTKSLVEFFRYWKQDGELKEATTQQAKEKARKMKAEATSTEIENTKKLLDLAKEHGGTDIANKGSLGMALKAIETINSNIANGNLRSLNYLENESEE